MLEKIFIYIKDKFELKDEHFEKIKYLFLFSFGLGFFVAFYFVPANSKFLEYYGYSELPLAYVVSGLVGVAVISLYSFLQIKKKFKLMFLSAIFWMIAVGVFVKIFQIVLKFNILNLDYDLLSIYNQRLSFFVFIWAWPFIAIVATITGAISLQFFNLLEVKKFYGIINLGGVLAAVIAYFSISFIIKILPSQYDLILLGLMGLFFAIYILKIIYKKFPQVKIQDLEISPNISIFKALKNRYILYIIIVAVISATIIYFSDYGFLITVKANKSLYFDSQTALAQYLTIVYALLKIGEFIISIFSGNILTKGGLKVGLLAMPVFLTFVYLVSFIVAETIGIATIIFLLLITIAKMFERILRRGVDEPAFNVLYQTLPDKYKLLIQTRVGIAQQIAITISGLLLMIFSWIFKQNDLYVVAIYPLFALPVLFLFVYSAFKIYTEYKLRIKEILEEKKIFKFEYQENETFAIDILMKHLLDKDIDNAKFSVVILSMTDPRALENYAAFLLKLDDNIIRRAILANIDSTYNEKLIPIIENIGNKTEFKDKELKKLFLQAFFRLDFSDINQLSLAKIKTFAMSEDEKQLITAIKFFYRYPVENDEPFIIHFLNSKNKTIKRAAIKLAARSKSVNVWKQLLPLFSEPEFSNLVVEAFVEIGPDCLPILNNFLVKQTSYEIIYQVVKIFSKIGTPEAQKYLLNLFNFPNKQVQTLIVEALAYTNFKAVDTNFNFIRDKIKDIVFNINWCLISIKDLVKEKNTLKLVQALDLERLNNLEMLFKLLSFINPVEIVELIKINIIGENTIFAIELIDNFLHQEIKKILIPLFEPISISQKVKKLKPYFVLESLSLEKRLIDIILTSNQIVDVWTQARAIEFIDKNLPENVSCSYNPEILNIKQPVFWDNSFIEKVKIYIENIDLCQALWLSLLHPSEIVYTTALKVLFNRKFEGLDEFVNKLPVEKRIVYQQIVNKEDTISENLKLLRRFYLFYSVPENSLLDLAKIVQFLNLNQNDKIELFENNIEYILILNKGELYVENDPKLKFNKNTILIRGLNLPRNSTTLICSSNKTSVLKVEKNKFFNLLVLNNELLNNLFKTMKF